MRTIAAPALALLGKRLAMTQLVQMDLTDPVRVAMCRDDIPFMGNTFVGGKQTAIDAITDQGGSVVGLSFKLSGVPSELLSLALNEPIQGKVVTVWTVLFDPDSLAVLDGSQAWKGTMDVMPISDGGQTSSIAVTAEHRGLTFARPRGLKYTDHDQQLLHPGDSCLQFITAQAQHEDIWPAAAWFRQ